MRLKIPVSRSHFLTLIKKTIRLKKKYVVLQITPAQLLGTLKSQPLLQEAQTDQSCGSFVLPHPRATTLGTLKSQLGEVM